MAGMKDNARLARVRQFPCLNCERPSPSVAHHMRYMQEHGLGQKVDDRYTVPLCVRCHYDLHRTGNEKQWWAIEGIDPIEFINMLDKLNQGVINEQETVQANQQQR